MYTIQLANHGVKQNEFPNNDGISRNLADIFPRTMFDDIECAFEQWNDEPAGRMYCHINSAEDRLIAICQNIVDNDGDFIYC